MSEILNKTRKRRSVIYRNLVEFGLFLSEKLELVWGPLKTGQKDLLNHQ